MDPNDSAPDPGGTRDGPKANGRWQPLWRRSKALRVPVAFVAVALLCFGLGYETRARVEPQFSQATPASAAPVAPLLWQAWTLAETNYVDTSALDPTKMMYGAIQGMLAALGDTDHTRFLTPQEAATERQQLSGQYVGIGIQVGMKNGRPVIIAPIAGSPAQKAGIQAGDTILTIDGTDTAGTSFTDLATKVRGPAGSSLTLQLQHAGSQEPYTVTVQRAAINVPDVQSNIVHDGGKTILHVQIVQFGSHSDAQLRDQLHAAVSQNVDGIVLDLRDNPGGLLDQAIGTTSQFVGQGTAVIEQYRNGKRKDDTVSGGGLATQIPMVVLVNQGTASAAEIVAGALKDHKRAKLVGQTTFGTGTVLSTYHLSDGSEMLLGTEEWLTPNGSQIWRHGITPDQQVALPADVQPLYPSSEATLSPDQIVHSTDTQLDTALADLVSP